MSKNTIAVTGKVSISDFEKLNRVIQENPDLNKSAIISKALEHFLNDDFNRLENEINRLKTEMKDVKEKDEILEAENQALKDMLENAPPPEQLKDFEEMKIQFSTLEKENENLRAELEKTKNQPPKLKENQLLINIPETLQPFLTEVSNRETNRTGKKVTPAMILLNLFWAQISKGPGDHLPMTFTPSEIRKRLEIVKQKQTA